MHQVATFPQSLSGNSLAQQTSYVSGACPAGELALHGGWAFTSTAAADVVYSRREGMGGWKIGLRHVGNLTLIVYVECLKNAPGASVVEVVSMLTLGSDSFVHFSDAACTGSMYPVGGGFSYSVGVGVADSFPTRGVLPGQWHAGFWNLGSGTGKIATVYGVCLTFAGVKASAWKKPDGSVTGAAPLTTTETCSQVGTSIVAGGFSGAASPPNQHIYTSAADPAENKWVVKGNVSGGGSLTLDVTTFCFQF